MMMHTGAKKLQRNPLAMEIQQLWGKAKDYILWSLFHALFLLLWVLAPPCMFYLPVLETEYQSCRNILEHAVLTCWLFHALKWELPAHLLVCWALSFKRASSLVFFSPEYDTSIVMHHSSAHFYPWSWKPGSDIFPSPQEYTPQTPTLTSFRCHSLLGWQQLWCPPQRPADHNPPRRCASGWGCGFWRPEPPSDRAPHPPETSSRRQTGKSSEAAQLLYDTLSEREKENEGNMVKCWLLYKMWTQS